MPKARAPTNAPPTSRYGVTSVAETNLLTKVATAKAPVSSQDARWTCPAESHARRHADLEARTTSRVYFMPLNIRS